METILLIKLLSSGTAYWKQCRFCAVTNTGQLWVCASLMLYLQCPSTSSKAPFFRELGIEKGKCFDLIKKTRKKEWPKPTITKNTKTLHFITKSTILWLFFYAGCTISFYNESWISVWTGERVVVNSVNE